MTSSENSADRRSDLRRPLTGIQLIAAERQRQIEDKGYTLEHDRNCRVPGSLGMTAAVLLTNLDLAGIPAPPYARRVIEKKRTTKHRRLVVAGALIAAELDRLLADAASASTSPPTQP